MRKKGKVRIGIGIALIVFQILGIVGNFNTYGSIIPPLKGGEAYSIGYLIGYFSFAIVGIILLVVGYNAFKNSPQDPNNGEQF